MMADRPPLLGVYEGTVVDNEDPEHRNRVKVRVLAVHGDVSDQYGASDDTIPWAVHITTPLGEGQGEIPVYKVGTEVLTCFISGNPEHPAVLGNWITERDIRNAGKDEYIAGDTSRVIDGVCIHHSTKDTTISSNKDTNVVAVGKLTRTSRVLTDIANGLYTIFCKSKVETVRGDDTSTVVGKKKSALLSDVSVSILGKLATSIAGAVEGVLLQGADIKTYLSGIVFSAIAGSVKLKVTDPTGLVDLGFLEILPTGTVLLSSTTAVTLTATSLGLAVPAISLGGGAGAAISGANVSIGEATSAQPLLTVIDAAQLKLYLDNHFHTCPSGGGPSTPPTTPSPDLIGTVNLKGS